MFCERCRKEIEDTTPICPFCGAQTRRQDPVTRYGSSTWETPTNSSSYQQSYASPQQSYPPLPGNPPPHNGVYYTPITTYTTNTVTITNKNDGALAAEIILSLVGVFGVGWLIAGETTVGVVLLVCSVLVYWPLMILGTLVTFGVGLVCLGPLAIAAIILNAVLLNNLLTRKATRFVTFSQQVHQSQAMPPRPQ